MKKYQIVYADPPWDYGNSAFPSVSQTNAYPLMQTEDICALPVKHIVQPNALLFLWTTMTHIPHALRVIEAWGFRYITNGFTWVKVHEKSRPRAALPDFHELAAFLDAIQEEHIFRYCIAALNTWARPEAVCELDFAQQADFRRGLVDLNPPGRPQNNKIRPVIPLTENLRTWALFWNQDRPINYQGVPVTGVDARTFRKVAERAGTATENGEIFVVHSGLVRIGANGKYRGTVTPYTLRHFMATNIRNMPGIEVTREQRAEWMGHVDQDNRTTQQWYESFDRDYLEAARRATDAIMEKLNALAKRTLWPVSSAPAGGLTLVSKPMVRVTKKEKVRKEDTSF